MAMSTKFLPELNLIFGKVAYHFKNILKSSTKNSSSRFANAITLLVNFVVKLKERKRKLVAES